MKWMVAQSKSRALGLLIAVDMSYDVYTKLYDSLAVWPVIGATDLSRVLILSRTGVHTRKRLS